MNKIATPEVSNSALRAEVGIRFKGLQEALATFTQHLQTDTRDAWIWRKPSSEASRS